jgi:molecular chaperone GrpE
MVKEQTKNNDTEQQETAGQQAAEEVTRETDAEVLPEENIVPEMSLEDQVKDLEDRNLRLLAEMQNLRNRHQKDLKDTREYSVSGFANDMIALSENIYRAREAIPMAEDELYKKILHGIDLTIEELKKVFAKHGIERIAPVPGEKFNYELHQAVVQVPTNEVADGCVFNLINAGYKLKERILKPAMVAVAKRTEEVKN